VSRTVALDVGDILYDTKSKDIGVLIKRDTNVPRRDPAYCDMFELWVWEVFWVSERSTVYSEGGLLNMIESGHLVVHKNT